MPIWKLLTVPLVPFLLSAPADEPSRGPRESDTGMRQTDFALALHRELAAIDPTANAFASPLSVWTALSMLAEGARDETSLEFARVLFGTDDELVLEALRTVARELRARLAAADEDVEIHWADALWGERSFPFAADVMEGLARNYGARLEGLDFRGDPDAARERINAWVEKQTRERIRDLLPPGAITRLTRLVLTDAVYFKGLWAKPFEVDDTASLPFRLADGGQVEVPFLRDPGGRDLGIAYFDSEFAQRGAAGSGGLTAFELNYEGEKLSFVVLLPDEVDGLAELETELDGERLERIVAALSSRKVIVELPKLELAPAYDLIPPLRGLGFEKIFDPDEADLSGFVAGEAPDMYVTGAFHKAFLKLDEEGTEAAAATGIVVGIRSAIPEPPARVRVDRPFLFLIRERESGAVLFLGRVTDPSS